MTAMTGPNTPYTVMERICARKNPRLMSWNSRNLLFSWRKSCMIAIPEMD